MERRLIALVFNVIRKIPALLALDLITIPLMLSLSGVPKLIVFCGIMTAQAVIIFSKPCGN
jgi:hypothetical protein